MGIYFKEVSKHIITVTPEGKEFSVEPSVLHAKYGDIVYFQNISREEPITIFFPEKKLFDVSIIEKLAPRYSEPLTVKTKEFDSYPYIIYVHGYDDFASKEAAPKIIIYDDLE